MLSPLINPAPNMVTLLKAMQGVAFNVDRRDSFLMAKEGERADCLSALMCILSDQAEKDQFRLITINTEPKRIIMACNRQGKPPANVNADTNRTSIRCGCRMRVNINYHSKMQCWRITSYETNHNHSYGSIKTQEDQSIMEIDESFTFTESDAANATQKYRARFQKFTDDHDDTNAALLLHSMATSRLNSSSVSASVAAKPSTHNRSSYNYLGKPSTSSIESEYSQETRSTYNPLIRISMPGKQSGGSAPHSPLPMSRPSSSVTDLSIKSTQQMTMPYSFSTPSSPTITLNYGNFAPPSPSPTNLKELTATAMEFDRYSMLHTSFKRLIAMACKKREWTEEVLTMISGTHDKLKRSNTIDAQINETTNNEQNSNRSNVIVKEEDATNKYPTSLPTPGIENEDEMRKRRKLESEQSVSAKAI